MKINDLGHGQPEKWVEAPGGPGPLLGEMIRLHASFLGYNAIVKRK